jgi:hypothetical protein
MESRSECSGGTTSARGGNRLLRHAPSYWIPIRRGRVRGFTVLSGLQLQATSYAFEARASSVCGFTPLASTPDDRKLADARNCSLGRGSEWHAVPAEKPILQARHDGPCTD